MADLNRYFAVYMNKKNNTSGHFWGDCFYFTILEGNKALLNCMTYVDLNAIRAGIFNMPDQYEYGTIGYILKKKNRFGMIVLKCLQNILSECTDLHLRGGFCMSFLYECASEYVTNSKDLYSRKIKNGKVSLSCIICLE